MDFPYVDLHVHSYFSDGSLSPAEIAEAANNNGVGILAVADHDVTGAYVLLRNECSKYNIKCIPAVEIDSVDGNTNFHILAYGFDPENSEFNEFLHHTRFLLEEFSVKLIDFMQKDFPEISLREFMDFSYDNRLGGWKALHYFMYKGLTSSLKEGTKFYPQYGMTYDKSGFSTIAAVACRVRKAGGYAVLAHPGVSMDTADLDSFRSGLLRIISCGIDGIECYYPTHSEAVTQTCLDICRKNDLLITTGSDCHGIFGRTQIGETKIRLSELVLKDLLRFFQ